LARGLRRDALVAAGLTNQVAPGLADRITTRLTRRFRRDALVAARLTDQVAPGLADRVTARLTAGFDAMLLSLPA